MTTLMPSPNPSARNAPDHRAPAAIRALRDAAAARFAELGFPTTRQESWRYTSLAGVASTPWRAAGTPHRSAIDAHALSRAIPLDSVCRIVMVNGVMIPALSALTDRRVIVRPLREAVEDPQESPHALARLGRVSGGDGDDALALLNTSVMQDGLYIRVPRATVLDRPIQIVHCTIPTEAGPASVYPRTLVIVEDGASANIVEHTLGGPGDVMTLTCAVAEIVVGDGARCEHTLIQDEPAAATHLTTRRASLGKDAHFGSHALLLGASLTRNAILPTLEGEGGHTILTGIYLARDTQHIDTAIRIDHARPNCFSRQYYRGLADGAGRGIFTGRIVVHPDAQKTDAIQSSSGLLLSPSAHITTRPQLEIYADDVRCTHGSTIGQIDDEAIFYLRARGVPLAEARSMLIRAFVGEIADRFPDAPVREWAMDRIGAWLATASPPVAIA